VQTPGRRRAAAVILRLRHPRAIPIKRVTVNGQAWEDFDPAREIIRLPAAGGVLRVEAEY